MSKQVKCCKQTSALDVATQWACAELLQRWVCCITTTESSVLLRHHKRDYITCMRQDAGGGGRGGDRGWKKVGRKGRKGWGWEWECRGGWEGTPHLGVHLLAVTGVEISAVQLATTAVLNNRHFRRKQGVSLWHKFNTHNTVFTYSSAQPFPMRATKKKIAKSILILRGKRKHWQK